jgi:hypothetical protein
MTGQDEEDWGCFVGLACGVLACIGCYMFFGGLAGPLAKISLIISFFVGFGLGKMCSMLILYLIFIAALVGGLYKICYWIFS